MATMQTLIAIVPAMAATITLKCFSRLASTVCSVMSAKPP